MREIISSSDDFRWYSIDHGQHGVCDFVCFGTNCVKFYVKVSTPYCCFVGLDDFALLKFGSHADQIVAFRSSVDGQII